MPYHIEAEKIGLDDLRKRIETTDLVPSRASLIESISEKMLALEKYGIKTLASLRHELKSAKRLEAVAGATGIDMQYLILLRREIESYFPEPARLKDLACIPGDTLERLEQKGIVNTAVLFEATNSAIKRSELAKTTGIDAATLEFLSHLADLMRVQWVSPLFGRMLIMAGYDGAVKVASAGAESLCDSLAIINAEERFFKGKISLRDIKRLIKSASHV